MCPISCEIVKLAIKAHEECGAIIGQYVEDKKRSDGYCHLCTRNEFAISPIYDMGIDEEDEE